MGNEGVRHVICVAFSRSKSFILIYLRAFIICGSGVSSPIRWRIKAHLRQYKTPLKAPPEVQLRTLLNFVARLENF